MAEITSAQAGNLSATSTWTGGVSPGVGDTVTFNHNVTIDQNTTIGTSDVAGTVVATVSSGIAVTVATGVSFKVRGDLVLDNGRLIMSAGSTYTFDSSLAAGNPIYKVVGGTTGGQTNTKFITQGTSGSRVTINKASGSGNGLFQIYTSAASANFQANLAYTDCYDLGSTSTTGWGKDAFHLNAPNSGQEITASNCTFTRCSNFYPAGVHGAADLSIKNNVFNAALGSDFYSIWLNCSNKTTGKREFVNNVASDYKNIVVFRTSTLGFSMSRNVFNRVVYSGVAASSIMTDSEDNLFHLRQSTSGVYNQWGNTDDNMYRTYYSVDQSVEGSSVTNVPAASGTSGRTIYNGIIFDTSTALEGQDAVHFSTSLFPTVVDVKNAIILPNSRGGASATFTAHGTKFSKYEITQSTLMSGNISGATTGESSVYIGSGYCGHANFIDIYRNNLVWNKPSTTLLNGGYAAWHSTAYWPKTGTAQATGNSTTTMLISGLVTTSGQTLADGLGKIVITGKSGSGPEIGESATITAVTSSAITFSPAMSAAPDGGTTYKISIVDVLNVANTSNNATYNQIYGTVYDSNGNNGVTKLGYHNFWLTDGSTVGATDVTLTGSTNEMVDGPQFVDSSRNLATFDSAYLGNTPSVWQDSTSYSVGDIRSAQTTTFYENAVINYRCILAHTSESANATNGKPGSAASYRTNWEFASIHRIREAIVDGTTVDGKNYIRALYDWVSAGFAPRSQLLKSTGYGGADIGAVAVQLAADDYRPAAMMMGY